MGKGDKKSKRGKIFKGSFGNSRKRKSNAPKTPEEALPKDIKPKSKAKAGK